MPKIPKIRSQPHDYKEECYVTRNQMLDNLAFQQWQLQTNDTYPRARAVRDLMRMGFHAFRMNMTDAERIVFDEIRAQIASETDASGE